MKKFPSDDYLKSIFIDNSDGNGIIYVFCAD